MDTTRYADIINCRRPVHDHDRFFYLHPPMSLGKRAKVFSPFAALSGYSDSVAEQRIVYVNKRELCEDEREELNAKLAALYDRCLNSKMIRANRVQVTVVYFVPRVRKGTDGEIADGLYHTISGTIRAFDQYKRFMAVDDTVIPFENVAELYIDK